MKNLKLLFIIAFCLLFQQIRAQNCCKIPHRKSDTSFVLPQFIDTSLFISDIKNKLDLKSVFDELKKDTLIGIYMYTFDISEQGKLEPSLYYPQNFTELKRIQQFVETTFNNYRWEPGYKKKHIASKVKIYLQLIIYLNTDVNNVAIEIEDIETVKKIFYLVIPYSNLKSFN